MNLVAFDAKGYPSMSVQIESVEHTSAVPVSVGLWKRATFVRLSNGTCLWIKGTHEVTR